MSVAPALVWRGARKVLRRRTEKQMRLLLTGAAAVVLAAGLLLVVACNPDAQKGQTAVADKAHSAAPASNAPATAPTVAAQQADNVRRVPVDELKKDLDAHQAIVIDVRNEAAYKAGHIKGAQLIPAGEIDKHVNELPKDKLIVLYCS
jgi:Rieske Fe-S protein